MTGVGFTEKNLYFVTPEKAEQLNRYDVQAGDLLFARSGATLGKVCVAPPFVDGWRMTGHILRARLNSHYILSEMTKSDRIRACFQHCVLQYISGKRMSNQSLRERFGLPGTGTGSATASQIIAAAKDANLIKPDDDSNSSLRYARYSPMWG